ncbi:MAG: aldo/keto reductase [Planctomycetaceae bacterium]|nr:aldo/keto reductase [Planctomycetaceae bacterium]
MNTRKLGTTNIEASVLGFGAWAIGGWMWGGTDEKASINAVQAAVENGMSLIDTAPMYGFGRSEEIVGKAVRDRRSKVVLATKCGLAWDTNDWPSGKGVLHFYADEKGVDPERKSYRIYKYLRPDSIRKEVEQSLQRLQTDHIDLYQTHWQDETGPIADTMGTLLDLKQEGKIRAIGVSNVSKKQLEEYMAVGPVDVVQEKFSLLDRKIEENGIFEMCKKNGISVLAYSPLGNGLLTGGISPDRVFNDGDLRKNNPRFSPENIERINAKLRKLLPICEKYSLTIGQTVIAWTAAYYDRMHVLCGARTAEQVEENAAAGDVRLTPEEIGMVEKVVCGQ